jgi:adenosylhomocysteinase
LIVDDGADLTLMIHLGVKSEIEYENSGKLPDPSSVNQSEKDLVSLLRLLRDLIPLKKDFFRRIAKNMTGVSEETTTGVGRLRKMAEDKELLFSVITV